MKVFRRSRVVAIGMLAPLLLLSTAIGGSSAGASGGTINIGLVSPITGPYAGVGIGYEQGLEVAFNAAAKAGGVLGGKTFKISAINESLTDPTVSTGAMRTFASQGDKIVVGAALSQDCLASAPVAQQLGLLDISPGCANSQLIGPKRLAKYFFSSAGNDTMVANSLETALSSRYPKIKSIYSVNYNYIVGQSLSAALRTGFKKKFPGLGGEDFFAALGATDYTSIVSSLSAKATGPADTQGLILTNYGSGALTFIQEAKQAGILNHFAFIATAYEYYAAATALNGTAPDVWDAYVYPDWQAFNNPVNNAFVSAYKKLAGSYPNDWGFSGYITGLAIVQALKKTNSLSVPALSKALEGMTINGPTGSFVVQGSTHHFLMPAVVAETVGSKSSPGGVKLIKSISIPGVQANAGTQVQ